MLQVKCQHEKNWLRFFSEDYVFLQWPFHHPDWSLMGKQKFSFCCNWMGRERAKEKLTTKDLQHCHWQHHRRSHSSDPEPLRRDSPGAASTRVQDSWVDFTEVCNFCNNGNTTEALLIGCLAKKRTSRLAQCDQPSPR